MKSSDQAAKPDSRLLRALLRTLSIVAGLLVLFEVVLSALYGSRRLAAAHVVFVLIAVIAVRFGWRVAVPWPLDWTHPRIL